MIIQPSVTYEYRNLIDQVQGDADAKLTAILSEVQRLPAGQQQEALHDLLPALGERSGDAVSQVSAVFFDRLMELQGARRPVGADILPPYDTKVWHALVGWAFAPDKAGLSVLERGGTALLYSLLSGGLSRILSEVGADTMIGNAEIQSEVGSAQRVPQPGCCNWCGMLASRFGEYKSSKSAGVVVGRGVPVGEGKGRGSYGRGRGIKTRGARSLGESYHDHCRCSIVILTKGNYAQLQSQADKYYEAYREAADKVNDGLTLRATDVSSSERLKNKYEWVKADGSVTTPKSRTNEIVRAMDKINPLG